MTKEKKPWIVEHPVLTGIISLVIVIVILSNTTNNSPNYETNTAPSENSNPAPVVQEEKFSSLSSCRSLDLESGEQLPCVVSFAVKNPVICEQFFTKEYFKGLCYYKVALEKNDGNLCTSVCAWDTSPYFNEGNCWDCKVKFSQLNSCEDKCKNYPTYAEDDNNFNKCYLDCMTN